MLKLTLSEMEVLAEICGIKRFKRGSASQLYIYKRHRAAIEKLKKKGLIEKAVNHILVLTKLSKDTGLKKFVEDNALFLQNEVRPLSAHEENVLEGTFLKQSKSKPTKENRL